MSKRTPYDTGKRAEPKQWEKRHFEDEDDYGKVDFNADDDYTIATLYIEKEADGSYTLKGYTNEYLKVEIESNDPPPADPVSSDWPEHEKLAKVATEVHATLEFINEGLDRDREPIPDDLVYAHWGVDYNKIIEERKQMLATYQEKEAQE